MVTIDSVKRIDVESWEISYSSDIVGATFYLYLDGALIAVTDATAYVIDIGSEGSPVIDIEDDPNVVPKSYPRRFVLAWYPAAGAATYRVEEQVGSDWLIRASLPDNGEGYFRFTSRAVEDAQTHNFRVTAIGANGNLGTVASLSALMVRVPDPPELTISYSASTHQATFSAA